MSGSSERSKERGEKEKDSCKTDTRTLKDLQADVVEKRREVPKKIKELYSTHQSAIMNHLKAISTASLDDDDVNEHRIHKIEFDNDPPLDVSNKLIELNKRLDVLQKAKQIIDNS